jgi:hypothetical protein
MPGTPTREIHESAMMNATVPRVVLDTNVLVAAARSRQGASFALVSSIPSPEFQLVFPWLFMLNGKKY